MNERVSAKTKQAPPKAPPARPVPSTRRTEPTVPPVVHEVLRSPGQPLDPATRAFVEPRFGHDFGRVRVHHDAGAAEAARKLDSLAFTSGQHVCFGAGAYQPETPAGRRLLAHELAHTVQQRGAQPSTGNPVIQPHPIVSRPGDRLEREADAAADRVAAGGRLAPGAISPAPAGTRTLISRQVATLAVRDPAEGQLEAEELMEHLAKIILRDLRRDPGDVSGGTRQRLDRLDSSTREAVLERIEALATPEQSMQLAQILAAPAPGEAGEVSEPAPEAALETPRPETEEARAESRELGDVSLEPATETAPPADVAEVTAAPAGTESASATEPVVAAAEAATVSPEEPQPGTGDVPVPEIQAEDPDRAAESVAPPVTAAPEPPATTEGAAPQPTSEDATPEPETGPIEKLEAEAEELGTEEEELDTEGEESEAEPEDRAALPEPFPEVAETPPEAGPVETDSDLATPEPTSADIPEEPAAGAVAPEEVPLAPEEAGDEGLTGGGDMVSPEPDGTEMDLGDVDLGSVVEEDASMGGEAPTGGGGGGGTPIPEPAAPEVPDVSQADPAQALATVSGLPPSRLAVALGGVSAAASRSVNEQRTELAANPPEVERPSGAHGTREAPAAENQAPPVEGPRRVERVPEGSSAPVPRPAPLPSAPAPPTELVRPPQVGNTPQGGPSAQDGAALRASLRRLPTHDPALEITAGPPPTLALEGDADLERGRDQRARLDESVAEAREQGWRDREAAQQVGDILPDVPRERLRAEVPTGEGGGGAVPAAAIAPTSGAPADGDDEAASIIAQEQQGGQIRAAVAQAQTDVNTRRQEHVAQVAEHRPDARREMDELVNNNAADQARERTAAFHEVRELSGEWDEAQRGLLDSSRAEADTVAQEGSRDLTQERTQAEAKAAQHIQDGNLQAAEARQRAEEQAARERQSAENQSEGILDWLADRATAFFNEVKNRIQQAFEAARAAVRSAIQRAQQLATDVIEAARRNIVGIISRVGDALVSIGDRLLADFPGLRDRFRTAIRDGWPGPRPPSTGWPAR